MSRKKSRPVSPQMDMRKAGAQPERLALPDDPREAASRIRAAAADPSAPPGIKLAAQRALLLAEQARRLKSSPWRILAPSSGRIPFKSKKSPGRPKNTDMERAVAEYQFDVDHYDALRALVYGGVPPDKFVLDVTIDRNWPSLPADMKAREDKRNALKAAIKRRRVKPKR